MIWRVSYRADPLAKAIADRHYNRQNPDSAQFVPPGRCLVLMADRALWVTSWPLAEWVRHAWAGAWMNSCFRNEGGGRASDMIREAAAATRAMLGTPPERGMVTFVDPANVRPTMVRGAKVYGWSYSRAGFRHVGFTKSGLWAWQLLPEDMPEPSYPIGATMDLAV